VASSHSSIALSLSLGSDALSASSRWQHLAQGPRVEYRSVLKRTQSSLSQNPSNEPGRFIALPAVSGTKGTSTRCWPSTSVVMIQFNHHVRRTR
jgi:hypothetical protein